VRWRSVHGLGLIVIGIFFLGAQLVLSIRKTDVDTPPHWAAKPRYQTTAGLPGIFGAAFLAAGIIVFVRNRGKVDPTEGRTVRTKSSRP
jgi:drug/metabolite transporter (DMT)-like permease